jgi:hypothetical protein
MFHVKHFGKIDKRLNYTRNKLRGRHLGGARKKDWIYFCGVFFDISSSPCNAIENSNQLHNPCLPRRQNNHPFYVQLIVTGPSFAARAISLGRELR